MHAAIFRTVFKQNLISKLDIKSNVGFAGFCLLSQTLQHFLISAILLGTPTLCIYYLFCGFCFNVKFKNVPSQ